MMRPQSTLAFEQSILAKVKCVALLPFYVLTIMGALGVCIAAPIAIHFDWNGRIARHYQNTIPQKVGTATLLAHGDNSTLVNWLVPGASREGCSGAIFELTPETVAGIKAQDLAFFASATHGRGYPAGPKGSHYHSYQPWQRTPVPSEWMGDGWLSLMLGCMDLSRPTVKAIVAEVREPGSFYAVKPEAILLILPDLRSAVFLSYG